MSNARHQRVIHTQSHQALNNHATALTNKKLDEHKALTTTSNTHLTSISTESTATNTKLDSFSGHSNNTTAIGDGSTQLRVLPLGYNQSAGQVRSMLVDSAGHLQIDAVSSALPTGAATEAKQDVMETTLTNIETSVQLLDDVVKVDDEAITLGSQKGVMLMGYAGANSVNAGDAALLSCNTTGQLNTNVVNSVNVEIHGHTDISDTNTSERIKCSSAGSVIVEQAPFTIVSTTTLGNTNRLDNSASSGLSDTIDMNGFNNLSFSVKYTADSGQDFSSPLKYIYIFASYDNSEFFNTGSSVQLAEHTISGASGTYRGFAFVGTFGARYLKLGGNVGGTNFSACEVKFMRFNQGM
jgi:hypothetical protein